MKAEGEGDGMEGGRGKRRTDVDEKGGSKLPFRKYAGLAPTHQGALIEEGRPWVLETGLYIK